MGYQMQNGQYADTDPVTLAGAATRTTTAAGTAVELGDVGTVRLDLVVTGSPSGALDASVETSPDNSTWSVLGTFPQVTASGTKHKVFAGCDRYVRARWTLSGGSPSFAFSIAGEAV